MRILTPLLFLALAAPAGAAPFTELPLRSVAPAAACVRATGAPGELVRWAPSGARVWQAGSAASTPVPLGGSPLSCPVAAAQPGGAGVVAAMLSTGGVSAAVREPGGGWSAPATVLRRSDLIDDLSTAVSARGDAAVAWVQGTEGRNGTQTARVKVVRRAPGGAFGAAVDLGGFGASGGGFAHVRVGLDADGGAVVLWTAFDGTAQAALAPAGGAFGAPRSLSAGVFGTPSLAVTPDGRALAALPGDPAQLIEREPGAATFSAPVALAGAADDTAVALRAGGAAIVAWGSDAGAQAQARGATGAFGAPRPLGALAGGGLGPATIGVGIGSGTAQEYPFDDDGGALRAVFTGDGRPLVTWAGEEHASGFAWTAALAGTLSGPAQALGSPLRDAGAVTPVVLPSGAPAVAWSDNGGTGPGHVHIAPEGAAPAAQAAFPKVTLGPPVTRALRSADPLVLRVRCSAACDVRAKLARGATAQSAFASLAHAGTTTLTLYSDRRIGPGSVRVAALFGPPGATAVRSKTAVVRVQKR